MQIVLLEKVENLGNIGEQVNVRPGYARNFLIPKRKALTLTPENLRKIEERRAELETEARQRLAEAQASHEKLDGQILVIRAKAGPEGRLFGSIGPQDVVEEIQEKLGIRLERRHVRLPNGPIRELGDEQMTVHLHTDVEATLILRVESDT
jgi:large subunit ribosomal protein L9